MQLDISMVSLIMPYQGKAVLDCFVLLVVPREAIS